MNRNQSLSIVYLCQEPLFICDKVRYSFPFMSQDIAQILLKVFTDKYSHGLNTQSGPWVSKFSNPKELLVKTALRDGEAGFFQVKIDKI